MKQLVPTAVLLATLAVPVAAQTPPRAGADARAPSPTGSGRMLTRDELRVCLKQQESVNARRAEIDQMRDPLDRDKLAMEQEQQALVAERARLDALRQQTADLNARMKAHSERVVSWNERAQALQQKTGAEADAERKAMEAERGQLQQNQAQLEAERGRIGDGAAQAVTAFNQRTEALDQRVADWNRRNGEFNQRVDAVNRDRELWLESCGNRRYREEDETAIRQGK